MGSDKFRLTIIQPGEEVWSKEIPLGAFSIFAVGFHIMNAVWAGGEIVIKPNRVLPKAEMEELKKLVGQTKSGI